MNVVKYICLHYFFCKHSNIYVLFSVHTIGNHNYFFHRSNLNFKNFKSFSGWYIFFIASWRKYLFFFYLNISSIILLQFSKKGIVFMKSLDQTLFVVLIGFDFFVRVYMFMFKDTWNRMLI